MNFFYFLRPHCPEVGCFLTPQPGPVGGVSSFDELANRFKEFRGEWEYALARNLVASMSTFLCALRRGENVWSD